MAILAKLNSNISFLSFAFGLRNTLSISASAFELAENQVITEPGVPLVRSYHLSLVTLVTANLLTYVVPVSPSSEYFPSL